MLSALKRSLAPFGGLGLRWLAAGIICLAPAAEAATTLIGVAGPAAGREQAMTDAIRRAAEQTVADINNKGGVLGQQLELVVLDDACTEGGAAAVAQTFIQKQVRLVVGHPCAKAALTAAGLYGPAGVMFIATASRHPRLTDKRAGKTIFRLAGRDDRQGAVAADWLISQPGSGSIAVVHDKTSYSRTLASAIGAAILAKAQPAAIDLPIVASENDYAATIKALVAAQPKAMFFAGYPAEANIIITAARAAGLKMPVLGSDSLATPDFARQPSASDPQMTILSRFAPPAAMDAAGPESSASSPSRLDISADAASLATAQAIRLWVDAAVKSGQTASEPISAALSDAAGTGANFASNGDAHVPSFYPVFWNGMRWMSR